MAVNNEVLGINFIRPLFESEQNQNNRALISSANSFEKLYNSALNMYETANNNLIESEQVQLDFATGRTDDMLSVMMAQIKADTSLNFTIQVTNKVVESYREIMRMQI